MIQCDNDRDIILIVGDSWAAGTWDIDSEEPTPNEGIGHAFISAGYKIRNLAKPGGSNLEAVSRLNDYIRCNQHEVSDIRFILFWKTEFFREIWYYHSHDNLYGSLEDEWAVGYSKLKEHWVYRPYHRLTEISQKWKLPIYMVGGCSDCVWYDRFETDFPGVKIACQSMANLLLNGDSRIREPVFCEFLSGWIDRCNFLDRIKSHASTEDLKILTSDMDLGLERVRSFKKMPDFFGSDHIHPNDRAHKIIFTYLLENFPELRLDQKRI